MSSLKVCSLCKIEKPVEEFYARRGKCKSCYKEDTVQRRRERGYKSSPEVRRPISKRYYEKTKDSKLQYQRDYRQKNKEKLNERRRAKYAEDSTVVKRYVHKRRTLRANAEGEFSSEEWLELLNYYGNRCLACHSSENLTVDHVIPLCKGGSNYIENIQPLCRSCNARKFNKIIDFRPYSDVCTI